MQSPWKERRARQNDGNDPTAGVTDDSVVGPLWGLGGWPLPAHLASHPQRAERTSAVAWFIWSVLTVAAAVFPLLAIGWMGVQSVGSPRLLDLLMIPVAMLMLLFWSVFGAVLGRMLPLALAVPLAALGGYLGSAYPEAISRFGVRHVAGLHSACCLITKVMDWRVVVAPLVFYLTCAVLLWLVVLRPSWRLLAVVVATGVVVYLVVARNGSDGLCRRCECGRQPVMVGLDA